MTKLLIKLLFCFILINPIGLYSQTLDDAFDINTSGIIAERFRMTIIAENLANNMTLKDEETGLPYQKKYLNLVAGKKGVKIDSIGRSTEPFGRYFDPSAPQSDENGYFYIPNVHMPHEMITLKHTEALFDANISAFKLTKAMYQTSIDLLK
jgi:flagellar basal-body rod protein FlgC